MQAREPGLQAPSSLTGSKIESTHIFSLLNFFSEICWTSNIGKSNHHIGCLKSEGKTIKPTISNFSQNIHLRRLRATLNFSWQAPEGILEPGPPPLVQLTSLEVDLNQYDAWLVLSSFSQSESLRWDGWGGYHRS